MQMIKMCVGYKHHVGWRQVAEVQSRLTQALQNEEPAREVGIDDDILPPNLQKEAGMPDEGNTQLSVRNQFRFVRLTGTGRNRRISYQAGKLAGALAQSGIFQ